ncbi:MAG TPA: NADP-dependent oxidoreductase, partial [Solirubrobacteraceae bacterium]|jgi:NADPH:quinone reductase-like Zn-dependent oxidoreductase
VDWKTRSGKGMAAVLGDPPFVPGWDVAGVVEDVGRGVTRFAPGDRVFGMPWFPRPARAYAEYVTAPSRHFARTPDHLDDAHAGAIPLCGLTAWQALVDTAALQPGQRVLVHAAAGGVGHLAVQIAKSRGAHVLGTARAEKHDFLRDLGVDEPIDYTQGAWEEAAGEVDVVLDLIGTTEYGQRSLRCLREGGLLIPVPSGADQQVLEDAKAQGKRATGILVEPDGHALEELAALAADGKLRVELSDVVPLAEASRAHELGEQGRTRGKLVLAVD